MKNICKNNLDIFRVPTVYTYYFHFIFSYCSNNAKTDRCKWGKREGEKANNISCIWNWCKHIHTFWEIKTVHTPTQNVIKNHTAFFQTRLLKEVLIFFEIGKRTKWDEYSYFQRYWNKNSIEYFLKENEIFSFWNVYSNGNFCNFFFERPRNVINFFTFDNLIMKTLMFSYYRANKVFYPTYEQIIAAEVIYHHNEWMQRNVQPAKRFWCFFFSSLCHYSELLYIQ